MCQAAADSGEQQVKYGMFEHRAVPDFEQMADIGLIAARAWALKRHVTDAPGGFDQFFAGDLGVRRPIADIMIRQEIGQRLFDSALATPEIEAPLAGDT